MLIKTQGLVLKQRNIGENDRIITILSKDLGVIEASARGVKRMKSPLAAATQVLCYSEFCLYQGKWGYTVDSAEVQHLFYDLRLDVQKLALASYFCDITVYLVPAEQKEDAWPSLRLLLNCLALMEQDKKPVPLLKSIFELRMMALNGFMPDLVCCSGCGCFEGETMYFLPVQAQLVCGDCASRLYGEENAKLILPPAVLQAMRHIIYSDDSKVFSFQLTGKSLEQLNFVTEYYALVQTEREFKSLEVYRQLMS